MKNARFTPDEYMLAFLTSGLIFALIAELLRSYAPPPSGLVAYSIILVFSIGGGMLLAIGLHAARDLKRLREERRQAN